MASQAAGTALGTMFIVAVEQGYPQNQRLIQDSVARSFLPGNFAFIARLAGCAPIRNMMFNATEKKTPGIWGGILCRKRFIDDQLAEGLAAGINTVVNLGAGFDTRAYRLPALADVPVFEVDLPENIAFKRARLEALYGAVPAHVHLVPIDFDREDLATVLAAHGYRAGERTFFIWEGVTQYLTEEGVRRTMSFLAQAAPGSRLALTYVRRDFIDGSALAGQDFLYWQMRVQAQVWRFGLDPAQAPAFLAEYGWRALEEAGAEEYIPRYIQPSGRALPVMGIERAVVAEKA